MTRPKDAYGNDIIPPDGSGYEDEEFDGEALVDHLLGGAS